MASAWDASVFDGIGECKFRIAAGRHRRWWLRLRHGGEDDDWAAIANLAVRLYCYMMTAADLPFYNSIVDKVIMNCPKLVLPHSLQSGLGSETTL